MCVKRPESVLVLIYTKAHEVLLLQRKTPPVDIWQSVTGSLLPGETPQQAAIRELQEETGLVWQQSWQNDWLDTGVVNCFEIVPEARRYYAAGVTENTEYVFNLQLPTICDIRLNPAEHQAYCWLPLPAAAEKVWSWSNREAILSILGNNIPD